MSTFVLDLATGQIYGYFLIAIILEQLIAYRAYMEIAYREITYRGIVRRRENASANPRWPPIQDRFPRYCASR